MLANAERGGLCHIHSVDGSPIEGAIKRIGTLLASLYPFEAGPSKVFGRVPIDPEAAELLLDLPNPAAYSAYGGYCVSDYVRPALTAMDPYALGTKHINAWELPIEVQQVTKVASPPIPQFLRSF